MRSSVGDVLSGEDSGEEPSPMGGIGSSGARVDAISDTMSAEEEAPDFGISEKQGGIRPKYEFEKHTTGFGSLMLQKMGFQGTLGAHGTGITKPIQYTVKKDRRGISSSDRKNANQYSHLMEGPRDKSSKYDRGTSFRATTNWRRPKRSMESIVKFESFADTVLTSNAAAKAADQDTVVEAAELYIPTESDGLDEFLFNYSLLSDVLEDKLKLINSKIRSSEEEKEEIQGRIRELSAVVEMETRQLNAMSDFMGHVGGVISKEVLEKKSVEISLEWLLPIYEEIYQRFREEAEENSFEEDAARILITLASENSMKRWKPFPSLSYLSEPSLVDEIDGKLYAAVSRWKALVSENVFRSVICADIATRYLTSIANIEFTNASTNRMTQSLQKWRLVLGDEIIGYIFQNGVVPKLYKYVCEWEPIKSDPEKFLLANWLSSFSTLFSLDDNENRLHDSIIPVVRKKLVASVRSWDGMEGKLSRTARALKVYFPESSWRRFVSGHIMPKLRVLMEGFEVDPSNQSLGALRSFLAWQNDINSRDFVGVLSVEFFPKWLAILGQWLSQKDPNFQEIRKWYLGWRSVFNNIIWMKNINSHFTVALGVINKAIPQNME